jgi:tetratricopeptide (TPR) repeat protein
LEQQYFIPIQCPNCKGALATTERGTLKCEYCGSEFYTKDGIPTGDAQTRNYYEIAYNALDSGDFKEANEYFTKVIELKPDECLAWFGKGISAGYLSTGTDVKASSVISCFDKAVHYYTGDNAGLFSNQLGIVAGEVAMQVANWLVREEIADEDNMRKCLELLLYWESKNPTGSALKQCWEALVTVACVPVIKHPPGDKPYPTYPLIDYADKYSENIRTKFNPDFRSFVEKETKERNIRTTVIVLLVVGFLFAFMFFCAVFMSPN